MLQSFALRRGSVLRYFREISWLDIAHSCLRIRAAFLESAVLALKFVRPNFVEKVRRDKRTGKDYDSENLHEHSFICVADLARSRGFVHSGDRRPVISACDLVCSNLTPAGDNTLHGTFLEFQYVTRAQRGAFSSPLLEFKEARRTR